MSKTSKQTDKIQEDSKLICSDTEETQRGLNLGGHAWLRLFIFNVSRPWTQACINLLLQLNSQAGIAWSLMSSWHIKHYAVAAFTSADICCVVVLAGDTHKSALQPLISSSGPFAMLSVFLHWHRPLWYTVFPCQPWGQLMNLALNQRTAIPLLRLDGQVLGDVFLSRLPW